MKVRWHNMTYIDELICWNCSSCFCCIEVINKYLKQKYIWLSIYFPNKQIHYFELYIILYWWGSKVRNDRLCSILCSYQVMEKTLIWFEKKNDLYIYNYICVLQRCRVVERHCVSSSISVKLHKFNHTQK